MYIVVVVETKLEAPRLEMSALEKYFIHDCLLDFIRYLWLWIKNKCFRRIMNQLHGNHLVTKIMYENEFNKSRNF